MGRVVATNEINNYLSLPVQEVDISGERAYFLEDIRYTLIIVIECCQNSIASLYYYPDN